MWAHDDLARSIFRRRLRAYAKDIRDDAGYPFSSSTAATDKLIGGLTLSNVRRGSTQAASLGYWMGAPLPAADTCGRRRALLPVAFTSSACTGSRRRRCPATLLPFACWSSPASRGRAWRAAISRSTATGKITCFTRAWERAPISCTAAGRRGLMPSWGRSRGQRGAAWIAALVVATFACLRRHRPRRSPEADRRPTRSGPHRDHDARRRLRGPRRQPAGRDRGGRRRVYRAACRYAPRSPAPIPTGSCSR